MSGYLGLIGPAKVHKRLGQLLQDLHDPKVVKVVTNRLFVFKNGCRAIEIIAKTDLTMAKTMLSLWKKDNYEKVDQHNIPSNLVSFIKNCITIDYRNSLRTCINIHNTL